VQQRERVRTGVALAGLLNWRSLCGSPPVRESIAGKGKIEGNILWKCKDIFVKSYEPGISPEPALHVHHGVRHAGNV